MWENAGGRCPSCGKWLTLRQMAAMPKGRVFNCRSCGVALRKTSWRAALVLACLGTFTLVKSRYGWGAWETWAVIAAIFVVIGLDGVVFAKSEIVEDAPLTGDG